MKLRIWILFGLATLLLAWSLLTAGPPPPRPDPAGSWSFGAMGDAPYYPWEDRQFQIVLDDLNQNPLAWVLTVGDIFWHPCTDTMYRRHLDLFNSIRHPVVFTPGDNEWTDCWEEGSGSFAPLERLGRLREIYFADPSRSLGGTPLRLDSQADDARHAEFVENARWERDGILFATLHLPGSWNGREKFPTRQPADDEHALRRTEAVITWMRETFALAAQQDAPAVVLAFHANPGFENPVDDPYRSRYEPWIEHLENEAIAFGRPVLLIHGDDHVFQADRPLVHRATGQPIANLQRVQVPGSPEVGWVRITVTPGATPLFRFDSYVVPGWKYW